jgi:hypothetical protein
MGLVEKGNRQSGCRATMLRRMEALEKRRSERAQRCGMAVLRWAGLHGYVGLCVVVMMLSSGCAQRTLIITSEPSGALVYLLGEEVGRTPMKYDFMWYSDYDVVLRKEGYETLKTNRKLKAPLSQTPPFDLFGELFGTKDVREWNFVLTPTDPQAANPEGLMDRAEDLKGQLQSTKYTRKPSTAPTTKPATAPVVPAASRSSADAT